MSRVRIPPDHPQVHIKRLPLLTVLTDLGGQCTQLQNCESRTTLIIGRERCATASELGRSSFSGSFDQVAPARTDEILN